MAGAATLQEQGRAITVLDEGVSLSSNISSIDFRGAGVTGTNIGSAITETVSGGGSSGTIVIGEVVSFTGTTGTLVHTPQAGTLALYRGSGRQNPGAGNDYTLSTATITLAVTAQTGEIFLADYTY